MRIVFVKTGMSAKLWKFLVLLSLLILLCGSASAKPRIYTGIFGLWAWGDWDEAFALIKDNGFDIAVGVSEEENLNKAYELGLKCIVDHEFKREALSSKEKWTAYLNGLRSKVERFKNHPAVFAWYVVDEPDWQEIPIEKIKAITDLVRSIDKTKPLFTVLTLPDKWRAYLPYFDIVSIDPYLKRNRDGTVETPEKVREWIRRLKADLKKSKLERSLWVVLGAFEERPRIPFLHRSVFKKPTPEELNQMVRIGMAEKVDGILIWTLAFKNIPKYKDWRLPEDDPALWNSVRRVPSVVRNAQ